MFLISSSTIDGRIRKRHLGRELDLVMLKIDEGGTRMVICEFVPYFRYIVYNLELGEWNAG